MIEYQELLDCGKAIFNFSRDEEFESADQLLRTAYKNIRNDGTRELYVHSAAKFAEHLAWYADQNKSTTVDSDATK